jgi:hypothetical protein
MKTGLVAALVAAFVITSGIFGIAGLAKAQTNSSDTATSGMSIHMGGDEMMMMMKRRHRNMTDMRKMTCMTGMMW